MDIKTAAATVSAAELRAVNGADTGAGYLGSTPLPSTTNDDDEDGEEDGEEDEDDLRAGAAWRADANRGRWRPSAAPSRGSPVGRAGPAPVAVALRQQVAALGGEVRAQRAAAKEAAAEAQGLREANALLRGRLEEAEAAAGAAGASKVGARLMHACHKPAPTAATCLLWLPFWWLTCWCCRFTCRVSGSPPTMLLPHCTNEERTCQP
jgi:hypothetical protein